MSPEPTRPKSLILENLPNLLGRNSADKNTPSPPSPATSLLPDIEEIRVSPVIAKKGYLNILEEKTKGWKKRWVIVRRPYVFVFRDERDPCERALVNLATARTEYNCITPLGAGVKVPNSFSIVTNHRGYLIQVKVCLYNVHVRLSYPNFQCCHKLFKLFNYLNSWDPIVVFKLFK